MLQPAAENNYGDRYQAVVTITGSSGVVWRIRTGWIVLFGEDTALICHRSARKIWERRMSQFQLFDLVNLTEEITLTEGGVAPAGTVAAIIEVFKDGEAYMVELFGGWVKAEVARDFVPAIQNEPGAFMETLGVETVYPHQLKLAKPVREIVGEYQFVRQ